MMTTEEMVTALIDEAVICPQIEEGMVVGDLPVRTAGIGEALIMVMDQSQVQERSLGEVLTMVELRVLSMKDITGLTLFSSLLVASLLLVGFNQKKKK